MYWGAGPSPDAPRVGFNPPDPLSKGAIRACGLSIAAGPSLPASSGPASDDAQLALRSVLFRYVMQLGQTLMLRAAFSSSTYLLPQIPGPGRSSDDDLLDSRIIQTDFFRGHPLSKGAHQATVRTGAHGHRFAVLRSSSEDALVAFRTLLLRFV